MTKAVLKTVSLARNRRFEGGMLFGGTDSGYFAVWIEEEMYIDLGRPTRIYVDVNTEEPASWVLHR